MNIREFSLNLQKVYAEMGETFSFFQKNSGLMCLPECGRCCQNPDIEASPLEMIPFALKIYDEGKLSEWLLRMELTQGPLCALYVAKEGSGNGYCESYQERPAVCRMFGVAGAHDKRGEVKLSICKHIKAAQPDLSAEMEMNKDPTAPDISTWFSKLTSLHPDLKHKMKINDAIKNALHKIALVAQYNENF